MSAAQNEKNRKWARDYLEFSRLSNEPVTEDDVTAFLARQISFYQK